MPPIVSVSNVTSSRGNTLSMKASNCPRASIPCRAPLAGLTMARKAAGIAAASGSSGSTTTEPGDVRPVVDPCIASSSLNWGGETSARSTSLAWPGSIQARRRCRYSCARPENHPGGAGRDHLGRRVRWPRDDTRHYRRVDNAQALKAMHAQPRVDNGELIDTHLAGAHRMSEARRRKPCKLAD